MAEIFRAAQVVPMDPDLPPVIVDGAVACDAGSMGQERTILATGGFAEVSRAFSGPVRDLGDVTLAPAVFNSHTHLEMTHLLGKVVSGQGFVAWVKSLLTHPLYTPDDGLILRQLARLEARGTAFVADISTRNASRMAGLLAKSGHHFASFQEVIGGVVPEDPEELFHTLPLFSGQGAGQGAGLWGGPEGCQAGQAEIERGVLSISGHALYSTNPELLRAGKLAASRRGLPYSLHLAEHADEDAILLTGRSEFLDLLMERGFLTHYDAPGKRPVPLASALGLLDEKTLAVHCVTVTDTDMDTLAQSGASVCLCPRSNEHIGVGQAPARELLARGVNLCLGTDGLCSAPDLDVYGELARLKTGALPELALADGLAMLTANPARFFGLADRLGSLAPGRLARFSVVPPEVAGLFEA